MSAPNAERRATEAFRRRFGGAPAALARAPGRVNLLGEHTDYNEGFVLPVALDRAAAVAFRPRADGRVCLIAADLGEEDTFDAAAPDVEGGHGWQRYARAAAAVLAEDGAPAAGWDGAVASDVPRGAGLASSAALLVAVLRASAWAAGEAWDPLAAARRAQRAEHVGAGVACGLMDPLASAAGCAGHALLIDCRTGDVQPVPLPRDVAVVVLDSGTRRALAGSAYNARRAACEAVARALGVSALRDATLAQVDAAELGEEARRRARHVVTENARTLAAAEALARGDAARAGALLLAGHVSLRDDFEVSTPALDALVTIAARHPACLGARMTGAGFGGCAVALVREEAASAFAEVTARVYAEATGHPGAAHVVHAADGASVVPLVGAA